MGLSVALFFRFFVPKRLFFDFDCFFDNLVDCWFDIFYFVEFQMDIVFTLCVQICIKMQSHSTLQRY
jgi:hypothetical protein